MSYLFLQANAKASKVAHMIRSLLFPRPFVFDIAYSVGVLNPIETLILFLFLILNLIFFLLMSYLLFQVDIETSMVALKIRSYSNCFSLSFSAFFIQSECLISSKPNYVLIYLFYVKLPFFSCLICYFRTRLKPVWSLAHSRFLWFPSASSFRLLLSVQVLYLI